jgi:hypothetical protein
LWNTNEICFRECDPFEKKYWKVHLPKWVSIIEQFPEERMLSGIGSQNWVNCGSVCVKFCCFFEKENILEKRGAKYGNMEKLDQGNLHPILEQPETDMFRPGVEPGPLRLDASILEKSNSNSFLIAIRNIYMNRR